MTDRDDATARAALDARKTELETLLERLARDEQSIRQDRADANADDEHDPEGTPLSAEWQRLDGLQRAMRVELAEVEAALTRVTDGTYGLCERCGSAIPAARLEVRPMATMCVPCADQLASGRQPVHLRQTILLRTL